MWLTTPVNGAGLLAAVAPALLTRMSPGQMLLTGIYIVVSVALIGVILSRTTKDEGLSGSMMGPSETIFRGKKSVEDKIDIVTNLLAVAFLILSLVVCFSFPS